MYGAQTKSIADYRSYGFENDVEMYGAQTNWDINKISQIV